MWTTFLLRANEIAAERTREARKEGRRRELQRQLAKVRSHPVRRLETDDRPR